MEPATPDNNYNYNPRLQPNAHRLRYTMTHAEATLWKYALREGQMRGYTFRRQRPVLNYIADFLCKELLLVIEVDGVSHTWETTVEKDERKLADLEAVGFTILRFTDEEVLTGINAVIRSIEGWIDDNR